MRRPIPWGEPLTIPQGGSGRLPTIPRGGRGTVPRGGSIPLGDSLVIPWGGSGRVRLGCRMCCGRCREMTSRSAAAATPAAEVPEAEEEEEEEEAVWEGEEEEARQEEGRQEEGRWEERAEAQAVLRRVPWRFSRHQSPSCEGRESSSVPSASTLSTARNSPSL